MCHGTLGGWDASSYQAATTTGDHAPVVTPGDVEKSLLAQAIAHPFPDGGYNVVSPASSAALATRATGCRKGVA